MTATPKYLGEIYPFSMDNKEIYGDVIVSVNKEEAEKIGRICKN